MQSSISDQYNSSSVTTDAYQEQDGYDSDEQHQDDSIQTLKAMVILWALLLGFYCYDERRSRQLAREQAAMTEQRRQSIQQRLIEQRRLEPERRKIEINAQIVTREIQNSDDMKILFTRKMDVDSLNQTSHSSCSSSSRVTDPGARQDIEANHPTIATIKSEEVLQKIGGSNGSAIHPKGEKYDSQTVCSICLESFEVGQKLSWAQNRRCNHIFHNECLIPWLMKHDECPYCRTVVLDNLCDDTEIVGNSSNEEIDHPSGNADI